MEVLPVNPLPWQVFESVRPLPEHLLQSLNEQAGCWRGDMTHIPAVSISDSAHVQESSGYWNAGDACRQQVYGTQNEVTNCGL